MRHAIHYVADAIALALLCVASASYAAPKDPLHNPNAVAHHIDRSAMTIPIQGWTRDLKYPVYPVSVMPSGNKPWYATKGDIAPYVEFDAQSLRCEIGFADREVLRDKNYECVDGVCHARDTGGIIGVDPRLKLKACR